MPNNSKKMEEYVALINSALDRYLPPGSESIVCEAMRYSIENGGKRIRPVLTLEFCRLCGSKIEDALPFACAVEMIHAYSLIHDDLPCMDNDDTRRGKPSNHIKFGEANALLAGDALLTLAFQIIFSAALSPERIAEAGMELSSAAGWDGMIGGQVMDLQNEGRAVAPDALLLTDLKKTGRLIKASALLGCIAANAGEEEKAAAAEYACNIGIAFQLVDDILDVTGDEATLGKPIGSDYEKQKSTYYSVLGDTASQQKILELTRNAKLSIKNFGGNADFLIKFAESLASRNK